MITSSHLPPYTKAQTGLTTAFRVAIQKSKQRKYFKNDYDYMYFIRAVSKADI